MITAVVVLAAMLAAVGPAVSTITHAPTTASLPTERETRARAPPRYAGVPARWTRPKASLSCPTSPKSLVPELQADGRVHDRMLDPYDRPE